jgi:hypothetical protein
MNYKEMKKNSWYEIIANPIKIATAMYYKDPKSKGLSLTNLQKILKDEMTKKDISKGLDYLFDNFNIHHSFKIDNNSLTHVYTLDSIFKNTLSNFYELYSANYHNNIIKQKI